VLACLVLFAVVFNCNPQTCQTVATMSRVAAVATHLEYLESGEFLIDGGKSVQMYYFLWCVTMCNVMNSMLTNLFK